MPPFCQNINTRYQIKHFYPILTALMFKIKSLAFQRESVFKGFLMRPEAWHISSDLGLFAATMAVSNWASSVLFKNSQPAEPSLPKPCYYGKPGYADPAFVHGTIILGENPHYFFLKNSSFFSLKVYKDYAEECVCGEEAVKGSAKSEEELEMEDVSLTLSFSYHHFPLSKYRKV